MRNLLFMYQKCINKKGIVFSLLSVVALSLFNCSAYFNTLYNGKNAFHEAQLLHNKTSKNYPDSLLVTAPAEAITKYERAIEKSIKVLEAFPKKKKWHDEALMLLGKSYYYKKDFQKAMRRFRELQMDFPLSPYIPDSYIYIGRCYIEDGNFDKAEEALQLVLNKYPAYNANQQITMLLVEIAIRREGRSEAIGLLEQAMKSTTSDAKRLELIIRITQLYIDVKQYQKAVPLLIAAPKKKALPEQSYRIDRALLTCFIETNKLENALQLVTQMASSRLYQSHNDEILFKKGIILRDLGRYDDAIDVFKIICKITDTTEVKTDSSSFRGKAYYEMGLIIQMKKNSHKEALKYFSLASKNTDTSVATPAQKRVLAIKKLDSLRSDLSSTSKTADEKSKKRIMIGELFRFDLSAPDSAFVEYLGLGNDSSAAKDEKSKALCTAALIARDDMKDTARSDSLFKRIIEQFPLSEYAQYAQRQLKVNVTIQTRQDSALIDYKTAEELFYKNNEVKDAIRLFYDIYKKYPDLEIAAKSLFAAAWYSDNVLQKKKTAKALYEKICEKYSTSIYCQTAAKPRIKVVIDTLAALNESRKKLEVQKSQPQVQKSNSAPAPTVQSTSAPKDTLKGAQGGESKETDLLDTEDLDGKISDPEHGPNKNPKSDQEQSIP